MIVCHCEVISDREVVDIISGGARTPAEVCRLTGAGRNCGTCVFSVKQLLRHHESYAAELGNPGLGQVSTRSGPQLEVQHAAG